MKKRNINSYFQGIIENIDIILNNNFYDNNDKKNLISIKVKIEKWYKNYIEKNTLIGIMPKELENIDFEITDIFDKYFINEEKEENYTERLLYDFQCLEEEWKKEMLREKNNE